MHVREASGASLRCREFFGATLPKRSAKRKGWPWKSTLARLTMLGGKNGSVFARLHPQTRDLAGDYGVSRGDIVRAGGGSDEGISRPRGDADAICRGSARLLQRAAIFVGERRRHEQDDGGHDDQANRRCRS